MLQVITIGQSVNMKDNTFSIELRNFYQGYSPIAHLNSLTQIGNEGHASSMTNCDILTPDYLTQGPALANLTNGTQTGAVDELINFIMDKAVSDDVSFGIGATKLFQISSTAVSTTSPFPHTITNATDGESCINMKGNLYYFYNKSSGADIGKHDLSSTFDDDWGSTTPTGAAALQKAIHPVAVKEDIMVFGNGRYLGTYIEGTDTLAPTKLDFGQGNEVADVIFHANQWYIAVNSGVSGTNRNNGKIFVYDGSAISSVLDDEVSVGVQRIGFLFSLNGIIYVAYQDLSSAGYKIGYVSGRQIKDLSYFAGSLPSFAQKTLYKNTILFLSSGSVYTSGAVVDDLPIQVSQIADGGYATCGAIAAPFGTPMISSTDNTNYRLAQFSGYDVTSSWRSIVIPIAGGRNMGQITEVVVYTNTIATGGRCDLQLEYDQDSADSGTAKQITGAKRRHVFKNLGGIAADYTDGTALFTYNSAAVVGTSTTFTSAMVGRKIKNNAGGVWYEISAVADGTHLTLSAVYAGTTTTSDTYTIKEAGGGTHEDFRVFLNYANGSATNPVNIRRIRANGHFVER